MKTNVIMNRSMADFQVKQRTRDGMFNATELLKQWNAKNNSKKVIGHYFENSATKELINEIKAEIGNPMSNDNQVFTKSRGGKVQGTWMHPFLFIDFAMWINPSFKIQVLKFVFDQLIEYRKDAGTMYKGLTNALVRFNNPNFSDVAKAMNWIVFNKHYKNIRQDANQDQLKEMLDLEKKLAYSIDMGLIKSQESLMMHMREIYRKKYQQPF